MKVINSKQAAELIADGATIIPGGFGSCGHGDALTKAIQKRFLETGKPEKINLLFASGAGDKSGNGLDRLAYPGLVNRAIGGFWALNPKLTEMGLSGEIEAHNWPQGVISNLFKEIARGSLGFITKVGINTFVDPEVEGGSFSRLKSDSLVEDVFIKEQRFLLYPAQKIDVALLRGTKADELGNISFENETAYMDSLAQAQAAKNCGGIVIVQVKEIVKAKSLNPYFVKIPSFLVDYVVVADEEDHPETYGRAAAKKSVNQKQNAALEVVDTAKEIIVRRGMKELNKAGGGCVNLGIGIPALIGEQMQHSSDNKFVLTIESGVIGGNPESDLSFGASLNPQAIIEQSELFNIYDGGGIAISFLGFAQADQQGNVCVSRFNNRVPGAGGFINISQSAQALCFCGTMTAGGLDVAIENGKLKILREGKTRKFVDAVEQITFSSSSGNFCSRSVLFITERAVFQLKNCSLELIEIAPGITVDDLKKVMDCAFSVSNDLIEMTLSD
ncbi:acyl CoA:acetate/3-ketoacid CoA transferase [Sessilibacter sp. MAH1]